MKKKIGKNVTIGPHTLIHENVVIGKNTVVEDYCLLGTPTPLAKKKTLVIGENSRIRSHSIFYQGSTFGKNLVTGHAVLVRENSVAGRDLQIGTRSVIDGDCVLGDYVKLHTGVIIAKFSRIGHFAYLFPHVLLANDPFPPSDIVEGVTVKEMAVLAAKATILPGVTVGMGAFVGAGSLVKSDVPDLACVAGNPAVFFATVDRFVHPKYGPYHPWTGRFKKKYPPESYPLMRSLVKKIDGLIEKARRS